MFIYCRTQGIILKKEDRGESSQFFIIYTKDFGKIEVLGKAIRKTTSKLRGGAELFYLSDIEFIQGKTYKTLTDAFLIKKFQNIRKDLIKLKIAYAISESLDNLVSEQEADQEIWQLLQSAFEKLDGVQTTQGTLYKMYYYFFWNLLSILGHAPELYSCFQCQKKLSSEDVHFSLKEVGFICQNCFKGLKQRHGKLVKIDPDLIKIIRIIIAQKENLFLKLRIAPRHREFLKDISNYYLSFFRSIHNKI